MVNNSMRAKMWHIGKDGCYGSTNGKFFITLSIECIWTSDYYNLPHYSNKRENEMVPKSPHSDQKAFSKII